MSYDNPFKAIPFKHWSKEGTQLLPALQYAQEIWDKIDLLGNTFLAPLGISSYQFELIIDEAVKDSSLLWVDALLWANVELFLSEIFIYRCVEELERLSETNWIEAERWVTEAKPNDPFSWQRGWKILSNIMPNFDLEAYQLQELSAEQYTMERILDQCRPLKKLTLKQY